MIKEKDTMKALHALSWLLVGLLSVASLSQAADSEADLLLNILVEKKTISIEEAASIRAEAAIQAQNELAKKKKFGLEGKTRFEVSGYVQTQYAADGTIGKFDESKVRRARLDFRGNARHDIGWRLQVDAVQPLKNVVESAKQDATTKVVTSTATKAVTRPILLDAYLEYRLSSLASLRVGQFKLPFGRENLESSPNLDVINRSQVTEKLVPGRDIGSQGRDIGGLLSGTYDLGAGRKVDYSVGIFNGAGVNLPEDNHSKDVAGRLLLYPRQGLSVGIARYEGKAGASGVAKIRTGGEANYSVGNYLTLKTEYVAGTDDTTAKRGWYTQAGYKVVPKVETVVKYDSYDPDTKKSDNKTDVATLGVNYTLNKWAKVQANYEWKIEERTKVDNNVLLAQFQAQF